MKRFNILSRRKIIKKGIGLYSWFDRTTYHGEWNMNVAQIEKGIMNVYIFLKNEKKYLIYYKNDLKEFLEFLLMN